MAPKKSATSSMEATGAGSSPVNQFSVLNPEDIQIFNQQREAKALADWARKEYDRARGARQKYERQWSLNMSFYTGNQNVQYFAQSAGSVPGAGKLLTPPAPSFRSRAVTNRIRPIIRTEMARLTSNKPNASVVPASSEDEDLFAAQAGEQVWESIYSTKKLARVFRRSVFWMTICGTSFTKNWWDAEAQDDVTSGVGTMNAAAVTPFHLFVPDLYEEEIEEQPFLINAYTKPAHWVQQQYGFTPEASVVSAATVFDAQMLSVLGNPEAVPDSVMVLEVWIKPGGHPKFPAGGHMVLVDNKIVSIYEGMLYNHNQYPFIKWDHIPTGMFYSESVISDLIPLQREYNRTKNQIIEAKNRMAKPQLLAAKGSIVTSRITSEPGQIIEYQNGMPPPQPLQLQGLPSYVLAEMQQEITDMEDISAQHSVSKGMAPPGVTAATAISFLQERDDSVLTTAYQSIEEGWEKWARQDLSHVVQFWDAPRVVTVTGIDGSFDALTLLGSELATGTDLHMESGSALPVSKAAKQALLMDLMKLGLIDPNKGLELMEMGGIDKLYDELKIDERAAQRENLRMSKLDVEEIFQHEQNVANQQYMMEQQQAQQEQMQMQGMDPTQMQDPMAGGMPPEMGGDPMGGGMPPMDQGMGMGGDPNQEMATQGFPLQLPPNIIPVNTWDNHQVHIDVHNRYRKTQGFEQLAEPIKSQFEAHVMMHAMALNQAAQAAMMMPPPPEAGMGAAGSGDMPLGDAPQPEGSNQFGPPGTSDGAPPPPPEGM